jgi:glyoxylase-like metal-dependent hydrolase (beta-lactamase superfamily II)
MRDLRPGLLVAALLLGGCASPWRAVGKTPPPEAEIVRIELSYSNVYLIKAARPVLVDSGSPGDENALREALVANGVRLEDVALVVLTHGHADHSGGAAAIRSASGAKLVLGAADARMTRKGRDDFLVPTGLMGYLLRPLCDFPFPPFEPDIAVVDSLDLMSWGIAGRVEAMPGHTPGSIVLLVGETAFVGDQMLGGYFGGALAPRSPGEHYYQDLPERNHDNIRALLARGVATFYLGHGGPVAREDVVAEFR